MLRFGRGTKRRRITAPKPNGVDKPEVVMADDAVPFAAISVMLMTSLPVVNSLVQVKPLNHQAHAGIKLMRQHVENFINLPLVYFKTIFLLLKYKLFLLCHAAILDHGPKRQYV